MTQKFPDPNPHLKSRFLFHFAWVSLTIYGGIFLYIAVRQILYPGFTEPMEGDILQSIERVAHGLTPYPRPGSEFIPLDYMPLYYYLSAPLYHVFGDSFIGPRLISAFAAIASGGLLGWIAWRESRSAVIASLAAVLYLAGYRIMDAYLICALPDSLMLFWLLLGFCFLAYGRNRLHDLLWLACYSLAFWTKQQGAIYFGFALLYALFFRRDSEQTASRLPRWALVLGMLLGGPIAYLALGRFLGDRFLFYTFILPRRWDHEFWFSIRRTLFVLACYLPFSSLLTILYLKQSVRLRLRDLSRTMITPLGWFTLTALLSAAITETSSGASNNHYIPFIAASAACAALGIQALIKAGEPRVFAAWLAAAALLSSVVTIAALRAYGDEHEILKLVPLPAIAALCIYVLVLSRRFDETFRRVMLVLLLLVGQLAVEAYYPPNYLPTTGYQEGIAKLAAELNSLDGQVIWISYGNVPSALTGVKIARAPSWVALEDIGRQRKAQAEAESDLSPFETRINSSKKLYFLSDTKVEDDSVWKRLAGNWTLVKDYGEEFSSVRQIAPHWYTGRSYPRYLYYCCGPLTEGQALMKRQK